MQFSILRGTELNISNRPTVSSSYRDADGDDNQSPVWTFPTVRPSSMNKLQKGYTHSDTEVRPCWCTFKHTNKQFGLGHCEFLFFFSLQIR